MAEFPVNPHRFDPYESSKFRVKWDGRYIPAITRVSPLTRTTQVLVHREGGDTNSTRLQPGDTAYAPIVLERGLTQDTAFETWASLVYNRDAGLGSQSDPAHLHKDIRIELYNEAGQLVLAWNAFRCWPSEHQALAALDASASADATERLTLQTEGWERDHTVTEPVEV